MGSDGLFVVLIAVLLLFSAFFSASETAYSSVNKIKLRQLSEGKDEKKAKKARVALDVADNFDRMLSTLLVGNNIVNILSASVATMLFTNWLGGKGVAISTIAMTILVLIFGEILPKRYAKEKSETFALTVSYLVRGAMFITYPVVWIFLKIKELPAKFYHKTEQSPSVTEEELKYIIETIEEEGVLEEQESELVQSALDFDEITVQEILTPRVDVTALDVEDDRETILQTVLTERYSRYPVYRDSVDNIIGLLYTTDLFEAVLSGKEFDLASLLREAVYVHKTKKIAILLNELKKSRIHMAIVKDDYGGTLGIVTMEDILEQLVGDILDEDDEEEQPIIPLSENRFLVKGELSLNAFINRLELDEDDFDSEFNTVGGWAMEKLERIPDEGDHFEYRNMRVTVQRVNEQRVEKLVVEILSSSTEKDSQEKFCTTEKK